MFGVGMLIATARKMASNQLDATRALRETGASDLEAVKKLVLPNNSFISIHKSIAACNSLRHLDLAKNALDRSAVAPLMGMTQLEWLNLSGNRIDSVAGFEKMRNLKVLNVSHNALTQVDSLAQLSALTVLVLNDNKITALPDLSNLKQLHTLGKNYFHLSRISELTPLFTLRSCVPQ